MNIDEKIEYLESIVADEFNNWERKFDPEYNLWTKEVVSEFICNILNREDNNQEPLNNRKLRLLSEILQQIYLYNGVNNGNR